MIFANLNVVVQTEKIICFGLKRYWILVSTVYLAALLIYVMQAAIFANYSSFSGSIELVPPHFALTSMGEFCLTIFLVLAVLLGVDIRARDVRDRLAEVLDTRPVSNLQVVCGRYVGVLLACWLPMLFLPVVLQLTGWVLPVFGLPVGTMLSGHDVLSFVIYLALPAIAVTCALAMFLTLLLRNRFVAIVLTIGVVFVSLTLVEAKPLIVAQFADLIGASQLALPSDLTPSVAGWSGWGQRLSLLLVAATAVLWMVALYPRDDDSRRLTYVVAGVVMLLSAAAIFASSYRAQLADFAQVRQWQQWHTQQTGPVADLQNVQARLDVRPGSLLQAEVKLTIAAPAGQALNELLLTLNPGLSVSKVLFNHAVVPFQQQHGGLLIQLPDQLSAGHQAELELHYAGKPDIRFAYLDSAVSLDSRTEYTGTRQLRQLGEFNAIFTPDYVALMPGIFWLPAAGSAVRDHDSGERDLFGLDLTVDVPAQWIPAGPAIRQPLPATGAQARYQFRPRALVPEVALLIAPFVSVATDIGNTRFEVLLHPSHQDMLTALTPAAGPIKQWLTEQVQAATNLGLQYPYDVFSLVDVPAGLRSYRGGWRMDSAMAPPAMVLVPEQGLPRARFDVDGSKNLFASLMGWAPAAETETDRALILRNRLVNYLRNDFSASNVFNAYSRNLLRHQLAVSGVGAAGVDDVLNQLTNLLLTGERRNFVLEQAIMMDKVLNRLMESGQATPAALAEKLEHIFSTRPSVWEQATETSFNQFNPTQQADIAADVMVLKGGIVARLIYDKLGAAQTARLLANVRRQYQGRPYQLADLLAEPILQQAGLTSVLQGWFEQAALAGFVADKAGLYQLAATPEQPLRYQLWVQVTNAQARDGFVRLSWQTENNGPRFYSEPFLVAGNTSLDFGLVLTDSPVQVYLEPYLALNRQEFLVASYTKGNIPVRQDPAFTGVRPSQQEPTLSSGKIIADDLDQTFQVIEVSTNSRLLEWLRPAKKAFKEQDQGLPVSQVPTRHWTRTAEPSAYGRFRHTYALIEAGDGNTKVQWTNQLPARGKWYLEIYLPELTQLQSVKLGKWHLEVSSNGTTHKIEFDGARATRGWNSVGTFDVSSGEVLVTLSNKSDAQIVVADAVAWSPVGVTGQAAATALGER